MRKVFVDGALTRICYVFEGCQPIIISLPKKVTNNTAEYLSIIYALEAALRLRWRDILVISDSQLIVRQLNKKYLVKKKHLQKLAVQVWHLAKQFNSIEFKWLPRKENLAGVALEEK